MFFPPEVLADLRWVAGRLRVRPRSYESDELAGLTWVWLLLLLFPFTDYLYEPLIAEGVAQSIAVGAFVLVDVGIIVAVLLSRGDAAGARFFGALVGVLDLSYAATHLVNDGGPYTALVYDVLYTLMLAWILAHIFRREPLGRLLMAPIVIGAFIGYLAFTIPGFISATKLDTLLNSDDGVTYYNAAASVIPVFLIAISLEGGWVTDVEGDSPLARALRHGLRLVTILVLAIAQAAAIGAMLSGGGSKIAYQITVQAMAVGFTAIYIMLRLEAKH